MKNAIQYTLDRVAEVKAIFGTLTDRLVLVAHFSAGQVEAPELSENDIIRIRRIVETGMVTSLELRPPNGHKVIGFLIALQGLQQKQYEKQVQSDEAEMVVRVAEMWERQLYKYNGDKTKAAASITTLIGGQDKVTHEIRLILNHAYKLAKSWEQQKEVQKA